MPEQIASADILERLGIAYCELDLSGRITQANQPMCALLHLSLPELLGRNLVDLLRPEDAHLVDAVKKTFAGGSLLVKGAHLHFLRANGRYLAAEASFALLPDDLGWSCAIHPLPVIDREAVRAPQSAAEHEIAIGRRIQAGFLPKKLPQVQGWEIACRLQAAREVSGDFYDAFPLSGGRRIGLVMGDVTDKGVGAALFMALFRSLIRAFADQHYALGWMDLLSHDRESRSTNRSVGQRREALSPGATALKNAVDLTNRYIAIHHSDANMFASIFFGVLDPSSGALVYINGGHEPPLLFGPQRSPERLNPTGPAVGLFPDVEYQLGQASLAPGDILLAYTDGVIDALSPGKVRFEEERLLATLDPAPGSAQALIDRIWTQVEAHIAGASPYDDITLLALRRSEP